MTKKLKGMEPLEQNKALRKIITAADAGYDKHDKIVLAYFDDEEGEHGDTLAKFIAVEVKETFEPTADFDRQCDEAIHYLRRAQMQLEDAITGISMMQMREGQTRELRAKRARERKASRPVHCPKCAKERGVAIPKRCPHVK